jgi:hypothetical protein
MSLTAEQITQSTPDRLEAAFLTLGHGLTAEQLKQRKAKLSELHTAEHVFQPRNDANEPWLMERHHKALATAARQQKGSLDPIDVIAIGGLFIVVDGHCRLKALRAAANGNDVKAWIAMVPGFIEAAGHPAASVTAFADALALSKSKNSKNKLPLSNPEKYEAAWALVKHSEKRGCYSTRQISKDTGASHGLVNNMQHALREHPEGKRKGGMLRHMTWAAWKDSGREMGPERGTDWEEALIEEWKVRLQKTFGPKPNGSREQFSEALERGYPYVVEHMKEQWTADLMEEHGLDH